MSGEPVTVRPDLTRPDLPENFDPTDPGIYESHIPVKEFAELRRTAPIWWCPQSPEIGGFHDDGYWVVTKHADVKEISKRSDVFSSRENTALPRFNDDITREQIELQRFVMLNQDAPQHTKTRKLVSKGFTPKAVNGLRAELERRADVIVKKAAQNPTGDFVTEVASELPLQAIADLIGIPQEDRKKIFDWSNEMTSYDDPEFDIDPVEASTQILGYAYQMADERRRCPKDDIITTLINADIDGDHMKPEEFGFFVIILAVAGNETTRNAITHGMAAFMDNPDQWELFKKERPDTTADEVVRYASPITAFQRTALEDFDLNGTTIKAGQRVAMFYGSANFDEDVFEDPHRFDITRNPNPHVGFGGHGAHYCIGANLARMEIGLMFNAIADNIPDITKLADPRRLRSGWLNGVKEFRVDYTGGCPVRH
ncbi:cytochrome P450 [Rhodococcus sp. BP-252]|uniref:Steroid C27-monooxygenase n=1 Tax=Rhodococcoides kyotonense TaxID=398843 RepID=A0A177YK53_9NOCA|nr:cytochrome P450 [Rhodococcus sp. BP-320]MBY6418656.1 cytochrome P450 [Rhodococcus sp. BP-321]MBY6422950.1 cytochrome P450 [Rhodococcus sp. BP-324]MBY6427920.1 cytochrome P450 [Rhodococcus sp. BP-323]MBY6433098.1 cytochrome P450 [Rhodococcus sp. BP-322]MBY6442026.1 cytochrome P450 [Rhodococcus sp. BP-319]MBY6446894.1 cytochrome P450 [Rhodococcus sp. BP-318]MBY6451692.1 cytochrome P450 [Rhodococcus sp. BP-315]MBY6456876.1 cytochrome P450 [Rhodococcus sp. BP-277]MBY6461424.1 cytochrome P45